MKKYFFILTTLLLLPAGIGQAQFNETGPCPINTHVTQNLKSGGYNGRYNSYTRGIVTQAHLLQGHLNRLGFSSGKEDGKLGPISTGAIRRMQTFLDTKPDGYVGPITRAALNNSCAIVSIIQEEKDYSNIYEEYEGDLADYIVEGTDLIMNGEIGEDTYDEFVDIFEDHPQITTLIEEEVPGSNDDETMIKLAYWLRANNINTMLRYDSEIASGGVDLYLSGVQRFMEISEKGEYPFVGVHSWSDGEKDAIEYPRDSEEHEENRKYIEDMLGVDDFYWFTIESADFDDIYKMNFEQIQEFGLITDLVQL